MRLIDADAVVAMTATCPKEMDIDSFIEGMGVVLDRVYDAPTVCKWHDPDEELPKKDGEYLCLSPLANGKWRTDIYGWRGNHFVWTHPKYGEGLVTGMYWWMEIPPMPKMGGADDAVD